MFGFLVLYLIEFDIIGWTSQYVRDRWLTRKRKKRLSDVFFRNARRWSNCGVLELSSVPAAWKNSRVEMGKNDHRSRCPNID